MHTLNKNNEREAQDMHTLNKTMNEKPKCISMFHTSVDRNKGLF